MGMAALNASINGLEISREELSKLHALMAEIETQNLESNHQPYAFASKKKVADPNLPSLRASLSGEEAPFFWEAMEKEIRKEHTLCLPYGRNERSLLLAVNSKSTRVASPAEEI